MLREKSHDALSASGSQDRVAAAAGEEGPAERDVESAFLRATDAQGLGRDIHLVELFGVTRDRWQPLALDVAANPLDDLSRRQRLAENLLSQRSAARRHDIGLQAELSAQLL